MFECIRLFNINRKKTESVEEEIDFGCTRTTALSCCCQPFMPGSSSSASCTKWSTFASVTHFILGTFIGPVPHPLSSKPSTLLSKRPELPVSCNPRPELVICISCLNQTYLQMVSEPWTDSFFHWKLSIAQIFFIDKFECIGQHYLSKLHNCQFLIRPISDVQWRKSQWIHFGDQICQFRELPLSSVKWQSKCDLWSEA